MLPHPDTLPPVLPLPPAADVDRQPLRLRQFLTWFLVLVAPVSAIQFGAGLALGDMSVAAGGVVGLGISALAFWARFLLGRGAVRPAVILLCAGFLVLPLSGLLAIPEIVPALVPNVVVAVALALPYLAPPLVRRLIVVSWSVGVIATALAQTQALPRFAAPPAPTALVPLAIAVTAMSLGLVFLLLWQFSSRLRDTLTQTQQANAALRASQADLEGQVRERTAALQASLAEVQTRAEAQAQLLSENAQQRTTIRELSVPVIPISATTLVIPLVGTLDTERLHNLQVQALQTIERRRVRYLVLDITGVAVLDSQVAQGIVRVVQATQLLGTESLLVGVRPEVAQTIVGLGLNLPIRTFADLQAALYQLDRRQHLAGEY